MTPAPGTSTAANEPARAPIMMAAGIDRAGMALSRLADVRGTDVSLGPIGTHRQAQSDPAAGTLTTVPGGLVYEGGPRMSVEVVTREVLPWANAGGLRVWCAVRVATVGAMHAVLAHLRRSPDFECVVGIEVDLTTGMPPSNRPGVGGVVAEEMHPVSTDSQRTMALLSRARENCPRGMPLLAKIGRESHDVAHSARAAVAGGATGLVLAAGVPCGPGKWLVGPAILPVSLALVAEVKQAIGRGRVPSVPLIASGGVRHTSDVEALLAAGASGVQVGSALLRDPALWGRLHAHSAEGMMET